MPAPSKGEVTNRQAGHIKVGFPRLMGILPDMSLLVARVELVAISGFWLWGQGPFRCDPIAFPTRIHSPQETSMVRLQIQLIRPKGNGYLRVGSWHKALSSAPRALLNFALMFWKAIHAVRATMASSLKCAFRP